MSLVTVTTAQLIADLGERVIGPAEAQHRDQPGAHRSHLDHRHQQSFLVHSGREGARISQRRRAAIRVILPPGAFAAGFP